MSIRHVQIIPNIFVILATPAGRGYSAPMANTKPVEMDTPITIRVNKDFLDQVDELRRRMAPIPSRSEVIRGLVAREFDKLAKRDR